MSRPELVQSNQAPVSLDSCLGSPHVRRRFSRRKALAGIGLLGAEVLASRARQAFAQLPAGGRLTIAGYHAELLVTAISAYTLRVSVVPDGGTSQGPDDLVLPRKQWPEPLARFWSRPAEHTLKWGEYK